MQIYACYYLVQSSFMQQCCVYEKLLYLYAKNKMITLDRVSKSYDKRLALNDLSIHIEKGEIYALLGPNGAGKSTTIKMLLGFLAPDQGKVTIAGLNPMEDADLCKSRVAYIPEQVQLYPYFTGYENLAYFTQLSGQKHSRTAYEGYLHNAGLAAEHHHRRLGTYSKGMRQKVGIAIALAKSAEVILLDEPASGLDPLASNELTSLLQQLAANGATILMASHDLFRVRETAQRIGLLHQGKLVTELQSAKLSAPELEALYLQYMKG